MDIIIIYLFDMKSNGIMDYQAVMNYLTLLSLIIQ